MTDLNTWFQSLPLFTRWWFALSVAFPLIGRLGLVSPAYMVLMYEPFIYQFQIWRPFTSVFYYPLNGQTGFHFLMNLYFLYSYSLRLETGIFAGTPAEYGFMLFFTWSCAVIAGLFFNVMLLMDVMVLAILYVWCQINKDVIVSFWFGTQFKAAFLPWVLLLFHFIIGGSFITELIGIVIGHLYYFLKFKYPQDFDGPSLLATPSFLYEWFPNQRGSGGYGQPPPSQHERRNERRYNWGQGHSLGGN